MNTGPDSSMNTGREPVRPWSVSALRYHVPFLLAVCFCFAAGWFELTRARAGHTIAWVYAFEWPLFGVLFAGMWWRIMAARDVRRPSPPGSGRAGRDIAEDDPGLKAWRDYLDDVGHDDTVTDEAPGSG
ncbi:MAG: hypothetical protein M3130_02090 [Actinomycetota bacterium]|nr:hypothetical protein [Actinomycetota bacterium]